MDDFNKHSLWTTNLRPLTQKNITLITELTRRLYILLYWHLSKASFKSFYNFTLNMFGFIFNNETYFQASNL